MHPSGYRLVERLVAAVDPAPVAGQRVLDVGSLDVNGSLRPIFEKRGLDYSGLDLIAGKNVDIVCDATRMAGFFETRQAAMTRQQDREADWRYDIVVSSNCLEHCTNPWAAAREIFQVLKPGGWALLTVPYQIHEHRYPIDCWRVLEDGMRVFLTGYDAVRVGYDHGDIIETWGIGRKPNG